MKYELGNFCNNKRVKQAYLPAAVAGKYLSVRVLLVLTPEGAGGGVKRAAVTLRTSSGDVYFLCAKRFHENVDRRLLAQYS